MTKLESIKQLLEKNPNYSARVIGEKINLSRQTVNWYIKKLNIVRDRKVLQKTNNTKRSFKCDISEESEQIILGSILGDGHITKWNRDLNSKLNLNSTLVINHNSPQIKYIEYKKDLFIKYGTKCQSIKKIDKEQLNKYNSYINGKIIHSKDRYTLRLSRNISYNKYRDMFYRDVKYINRYIYKLKELGLAIWYMDDGYKHDNTYYLCTDCFSKKDLKILQKMLLHNFKLITLVDKKNRIRISSKSGALFANLVKPFVCDSMMYKIHNIHK